MTERARPQSVPAEAWWSPPDNEWILGSRDAQGRLHGKVRYWRPDGTLCCICDLVEGRPHGSSVRFHESGEESQTCTFVDGELHGTRTWFATDQRTTEGMHANGVSRKVRRLEMDYEHGVFFATRFFDGDGNELCRDGSPLPTRPAGVDPSATFHQGRWVSGRWNEKGQRMGMLRHHSREGVLLEETEWRDDIANGVHRVYEDNGHPREEVSYRNGLREGTARTWRLDGTLAREAELSGGEYHGALRDHDETGTRVVREVRFEHGVRLTPPVPVPSLPEPVRPPPEDWRERIWEDDPTSLDLSNLGLERLPDEVRTFRRLRILELVNNRIRSLPGWLMELESLAHLTLGRNHMPEPRTGRAVLTHLRRTRELPALDRRVRLFLFMGDVVQARNEKDVPALVRSLDDEDPSIQAYAELALAGARPSPLVSGRRVHVLGTPRQRTPSQLRSELEAAGLMMAHTPEEADVLFVSGRTRGRPRRPVDKVRSVAVEAEMPARVGSGGKEHPAAVGEDLSARRADSRELARLSAAAKERPVAVEADLPVPPWDSRELARICAAAEVHPDAGARRKARARFRREAPPPLWAFVQGFAPALATKNPPRLVRRIRVLGRTPWLDERTLAEEVFRHTGRGDTYFLEEGGPETRGVLAKCIRQRMLDLSWKRLRRLPPEVCDFPDVALLKLGGNHLSTLPEELGDLFCLNRLELEYNPLRALPAGLARLNQLRELRLSDTGLPVTASGPIFTLTGLTRLNIDGCGWAELPDAIGQLTRLDSLDVDNNGLRTLPASLANLQRLTYLHMTRNDFGTVPRVIFELRALKTLWLEGCKLRELPADIEQLQALETLCLWHNELESIPLEALTRLPRLREVRIRNNKLPPGKEAELRAALPNCAIY